MIICTDKKLQEVVEQHERKGIIANLKAKNKKIKDLTGITRVYGYTHFYLSFNKIEDIKPLSKLYNAREIWLEQNLIRDLTPLIELKHLQYLNVLNNYIDYSNKTEQGALNMRTINFLRAKGCRISYWKQKKETSL